jgi:Skp family chaperone for outer membrane proteins
MKFLKLPAISLLTASLLCPPAFSQDATLDPNYESIDLDAGFLPDPVLFELIAGGDVYAGDVDFSCYGYVSEAPDYRLNYAAGGSGLGIYTNAETDTTLLINTPDGEWICDDDNLYLDNLNAGYYFENPQSGEYNIWVGTYSDLDSFSNALLAVTEYPESSWETNLTPTFSQDTFTLRVLNNGNEIQSGLATQVAENLVITNAALVSQGDQWIVENPRSGAALVASFNVIDEDAGLALLTVNGIEGTPVTIAANFPEMGRYISLALLDSNRQGVLLNFVDDSNLLSQVQHTALAEDGEYGAALLNNCNEVIGISQHSSPVLSNRLRPDQNVANSTNLNALFDFLVDNNVDFIESFDICLSEAEQLILAQEKIQEQEDELILLLEEQELLEEERIRLEEQAEALLEAQETLEAENQARLEELAAREAELEASQAAIEQAEAEALEQQARQEELEEEARRQEEALAEAEAQQAIDDRNRVYQWTGFGIVVIALFGFVAVQVKRRKKVQEEAEENINEIKQQSQQIESELQKASAEFSDIVLSGTDDSGVESRLKINGNALIRSENGQIIGRSAQHADYVLNLETVSRKHLRIFIRDNKIFVEDLNSANGTTINGNALNAGQEYELNSGDSLKIGLTAYSVNLLET